MNKTRVSRRTFLGTAAAATIAAQVKFAGAQGAARTHAAEVWPENGTLIPDEGWRLWVDEKAA
jgi:nitrous oxide reductase